jgi:hypothetical protein
MMLAIQWHACWLQDALRRVFLGFTDNVIFFFVLNAHCKVLGCFVPRYVGPCRHGMARPRVADGGEGLHIRRVAAIY